MENGETISSSVSNKASPNMEDSTRKLLLEMRSCSNTITLPPPRPPTTTKEKYPADKVLGHDDDPHRPLLSTNGGDERTGPTLNHSGATEVGRNSFPQSPRMFTPTSSSNIFRDDVCADTHIRGGASGSAVTVRTLQPFDISHLHTAFKSPGGGMAAALGFPFTAAQWKELERQAMVYKYMVASLPVPPDLLIPVNTRNSSDPTTPSVGNGTLYSLRYPNRDPEPGRCKRTDGKKWRCSRDVAPHQKYCERHMHRGRPRSRKHVEVHPAVDTNNNKKTRLNQSPLQTNPTDHANGSFSPLFSGTVGQTKDTLVLGGARANTRNIASSPHKGSNRVLGKMIQDGEMVATNGVRDHPWLHLMDTKRGLPAERHFYATNGSILHHGFAENQPLNLFSYADLTQEDIRSRSDDCHLFLNTDLISLKQPEMDGFPISRGFIDAWSNGNLETISNEPSMSSSQGHLSPSSLNLSIAMAAGDVLDDEMGLTGVVHPPAADSDHHKPKHCAASWLPFSSGGPLAEVLQPSNMASGSNPASPYATNTDSISPSATAVSSPSGVLQKAFFSQSDGSVCNSPTIAASVAPSELVAFQWFC